jgi:8-oxo-dGTP diphosphatase
VQQADLQGLRAVAGRARPPAVAVRRRRPGEGGAGAVSADPGVHVGVAAWCLHRGRLLMLRRAEGASHGGGTWSLPGGWVDFGEEPEEAVFREVREETGVAVRDPRLLDVVANTYGADLHVVCAFYAVEHDYGAAENREPGKHEHVGWEDPSRLLDDGLELFPPVETLLSRGHDLPGLRRGLGLTSARDLLTDEERADLDRDLARMAAQRRRAEAEARGVWLP